MLGMLRRLSYSAWRKRTLTTLVQSSSESPDLVQKVRHELRVDARITNKDAAFSAVLNSTSNERAQDVLRVSLGRTRKRLRLYSDRLRIGPQDEALLGLYAMSMALERWKEHIRGSHITLVTDNAKSCEHTEPISTPAQLSAFAIKASRSTKPLKGVANAIRSSIAGLAIRNNLEISFATMSSEQNRLARTITRSRITTKRDWALSTRISSQLNVSSRWYARIIELRKSGTPDNALPSFAVSKPETIKEDPPARHSSKINDDVLGSDDCLVAGLTEDMDKRALFTIRTDISHKDGCTTFAGVLNPDEDESAEDAFVVTKNPAVETQLVGSHEVLLPKRSTTTAEAYAAYMALELWGERMRGQKVITLIDNREAVDIVQGRVGPRTSSQTSSKTPITSPFYIAHLIGVAAAEIAAKNDIRWEAKWESRDKNTLADKLSRCYTAKDREGLSEDLRWHLRLNDPWFQSTIDRSAVVSPSSTPTPEQQSWTLIHTQS